VPLYGITTWGDIFTRRQRQSLYTYAQAIRGIDTTASCSRLCSLALDRVLILLSAHCRWKPTGESLIDMFGRHAIGMVWDFAESTPGFGSENTFGIWIDRYAALVAFSTLQRLKPGQIQQSDATSNYLPDESCQVWFTDPPYYDSIPYAHLSDCFYVWLKRSLPETVIGFSESLCPKKGECVVDRPHRLSNSIKDEEYFERKIGEAANIGRKVLSPSGCGSIVFAHKTTEGWEALLSGIIGGGWCITASWPIATELSSRLNARDTASLATSVHLVCRPRPDDASIGDWAEVLRELPNRVGRWMERLQSEGIRGADLVFACIGPALEIFSRYRRVETADGSEVKLAEYLEKVWEVVGRSALEQILGTGEARARNGMAGVLEEDARLTALFLWTLQATNGKNGSSPSATLGENMVHDSTEDDQEVALKGKAKGFSLVFDVVRRFAQPLGIELPKWEGRVIEIEKGVVRLMAVSERTKQIFGSAGIESAVEELLTPDFGRNRFFLKLICAFLSKPARGLRLREAGYME
jgi:putative DNA methylase